MKMLDFILSKLNLLILVTAIFAIVAFFAASLTDIAKVKEASELASKIKEQSFSLVNSPNYCFTDSYQIPDELAIAGSSYYYVLKVSKQELEMEDGGKINVLIYSIYTRDEIKRSFTSSTSSGAYVPKAIAADSFRTSAQIHLYAVGSYNGSGYDTLSGDGSGTVPEEDSIFIDPQAENPKNSLEFIKEVVAGKTSFYVIGCNKEAAGCEVDRERIGKIAHISGNQGEGGFLC